MNLYAPDYYPEFRCTAGKCRHTCCAGWEIDIDGDSLKRYRRMRGPFGKKINQCISEEGTPHFILGEEERCPLLNGENLCELILRRGEKELCQICADHPRFRNYWTGRTEIGLGLVCEEAGRLILGSGHPLGLIRLEGDEEEELPEDEKELMRLREELLRSVPGSGPAARLREYLIYRHLADALYDGRVEERIRFIREAAEEILAGWDGQDLPELTERARRFSDETEYDDEALEARLSGQKKPRA